MPEYSRFLRRPGSLLPARLARAAGAVGQLIGQLQADVNRGGKVQKLSAQQIRAQVSRRKGAAFTALAHVGYIYAQPYKQYSELSFNPQSGGVVVHMAEWYRLTFARETGQLKLTRLDYRMLEGS